MDYAHTTTSGQRRELARKIFEEVRKEMRELQDEKENSKCTPEKH